MTPPCSMLAKFATLRRHQPIRAMTSGRAIFYGATVDNTTGDPSLQIARAAP